MRAVIRSGGNVENSDKAGRAGVREPVTEHCAGCGDEHPIGAMIEWRGDWWCPGCASQSLYEELYGAADEIELEAAAVRSLSASARRRAAIERSGLRIIHNSEDTGG